MAPNAVIHVNGGGATDLCADDAKGLRLTHITTRSELNEAEQYNIAKAEQAFSARRQDRKKILDEAFLRRVHRRMFEEVWTWAGKFRLTEKNIGVAPEQIAVSLRSLLDDTAYWIDNDVYSRDEVGARFHHRLVYIHPFANGNGRHARLVADLLVVSLGGERFTWGRSDLVVEGETRDRYIASLVAADADPNDIAGLLEFCRS